MLPGVYRIYLTWDKGSKNEFISEKIKAMQVVQIRDVVQSGLKREE
jgi:hypothetical protein